ncbi:MAG: M3 family oligoendopeptidase, partial [Defluviitaleaceae bacterium]|nr:M3 family oligoendopeptidase [Defluviitaleaceae bacterium]
SQLHIYASPFYYIDYCLAQVVALYLWAEKQKNHDKAWERYKKLVSFSGTKTFLELLEEVGLPNPFVSENLKVIADAVTKWLER